MLSRIENIIKSSDWSQGLTVCQRFQLLRPHHVLGVLPEGDVALLVGVRVGRAQADDRGTIGLQKLVAVTHRSEHLKKKPNI